MNLDLDFDLNLLWAAAAGLVLGAGLVFLLMRRGGSVSRERAESLANELQETQLELESHREEVSKHFSETSDLFRDLTEQYTRLYAHLATGAREFCPDEVPSLGQGLDTPLLVDDAPEPAGVAAAADAATSPPAEADEEERRDAAPAEDQEEPREAAAAGEGRDERTEAAAAGEGRDERTEAGAAGEGRDERTEAAAAGEGQDERKEAAAAGEEPGEASDEKRLAFEAPVPGASPPPVGTKASGGSHLTH